MGKLHNRTNSEPHISHLQFSSSPAIDTEISEAEKALQSGCEYFIRCYTAVAKSGAVKSKINCQGTM